MTGDWLTLLGSTEWTPPEQRAEELAAEAHLLALDCVGLASFARLCEVEEARVMLDAELERPRPEPHFRTEFMLDPVRWARDRTVVVREWSETHRNR